MEKFNMEDLHSLVHDMDIVNIISNNLNSKDKIDNKELLDKIKKWKKNNVKLAKQIKSRELKEIILEAIDITITRKIIEKIEKEGNIDKDLFKLIKDEMLLENIKKYVNSKSEGTKVEIYRSLNIKEEKCNSSMEELYNKIVRNIDIRLFSDEDLVKALGKNYFQEALKEQICLLNIEKQERLFEQDKNQFKKILCFFSTEIQEKQMKKNPLIMVKYVAEDVKIKIMQEFLKNPAISNIDKKIIWQNGGEVLQRKLIKIIMQDTNISIDLKCQIFRFTDEVVQLENSETFIKLFKEINNLNRRRIWLEIKDELKLKTIRQLFENANLTRIEKEFMWSNSGKDVQKENIDLCIKIMEQMGNANDCIRILSTTTTNIREHVTKQIIYNENININIKKEIWNTANSELKFNSFFYIIKCMIEEKMDKNEYEDFVIDFLGDSIQFDRFNMPIIPKDLKTVIFNEKNSYLSNQIIRKLPIIIERWEDIKQYIFHKRANNIMNDGHEVRVNSIKEISVAADMIIRPRPNSASAKELLDLDGAEKIGVDTVYTVNPEGALQRSFDIAVKMDESPSLKSFPDFSVVSDDGKMQIEVFHPQDKRLLLSGNKTKSCFKANGIADNRAENVFSLLQYCAITPYGGAIQCDSIDGKNVYMGTPILFNGNMAMFHSYETANGKNADKVNVLLTKAASRLMELDDSINIVFMTDLYTGIGRLDVQDKVVIQSFFTAYTEEQYSNYKRMYTNLDKKNCILAVRVNNKILVGEQINEWFIRECNNDEEILKLKLNLYKGKKVKMFDWGRMEKRNELKIQNPEVLQHFIDKMERLEEIRKVLSLILQMKKLESSGDFKTAELCIIKMTLEEINNQKNIENLYTKSIEWIREEIRKNREEQLSLYRGEDIDLLAKLYGINLEQCLKNKLFAMLKKPEQEQRTNQKIKKMIKDKSIKEQILSEQVFKNIRRRRNIKKIARDIINVNKG